MPRFEWRVQRTMSSPSLEGYLPEETIITGKGKTLQDAIIDFEKNRKRTPPVPGWRLKLLPDDNRPPIRRTLPESRPKPNGRVHSTHLGEDQHRTLIARNGHATAL